MPISIGGMRAEGWVEDEGIEKLFVKYERKLRSWG
jgi:hypothetical protein